MMMSLKKVEKERDNYESIVEGKGDVLASLVLKTNFCYGSEK